MKTRKTIIAASIAALLIVPLTVSAKAKWEYHEGQWSEVVSYGNVRLSEDSAQQWGPWSEFVQPAAGGPSVAFLSQTEELYRPLPQPIPTPTDFCKAGEWCGYAIYRNTESNNEMLAMSYGGHHAGPRPYAGLFALTLNPDVTADGGEGCGRGCSKDVSGTVAWRAAPLPGNVAPTFGDSGGPMDADFETRHHTVDLSVFDAERDVSNDYVSNDYGEINSKQRVWVSDGWWGGHWEIPLPTNNPEVAAGAFSRYIYGDGSTSGVDGFYVAGITTSQAYLSAQRLGDVTACYNGNSIDITGYSIPVHLTVNFGNATWSGSWNNGRDAHSVQVLTNAGNTYLVGGVGFNAVGTISGANLSATNLTANDYGAVTTVTGKVQASFFGAQAGSVGGVTDIVKTKTVGVPDGPSLLTIPAPGYTAASNVQVFVADKVKH